MSWKTRAQKLKISLMLLALLSFGSIIWANWWAQQQDEALDARFVWTIWCPIMVVILFGVLALWNNIRRAQIPVFVGDKWEQLSRLNLEIEKMQRVLEFKSKFSSGDNLDKKFGSYFFIISTLLGFVTVAGFLLHKPDKFDPVGTVWISFNLMVIALFLVSYSVSTVIPNLWKSHEVELAELLNTKARDLEQLAKEELIDEVCNADDAVAKLIELHQLPLPRMPRNSRDFEFLASQWLQAWGDTDIEVTKSTGDAGLDVISANCVAQVKFFADNKVGRPDIQNLKGAASVFPGHTAAFFSFASGFSAEATMWATNNSVALFAFNVDTSEFDSVNTHASVFRKSLLQ